MSRDRKKSRRTGLRKGSESIENDNAVKHFAETFFYGLSFGDQLKRLKQEPHEPQRDQ